MHHNVQSSIIYNCQNMEAMYVSINRWMDEDMKYTYIRILLSHKNNEILPFSATCMDLEGIKLSQTEVGRRKDTTYTCKIKIQQISEYNKNRSRLTDIENKQSY